MKRKTRTNSDLDLPAAQEPHIFLIKRGKSEEKKTMDAGIPFAAAIGRGIGSIIGDLAAPITIYVLLEAGINEAPS